MSALVGWVVCILVDIVTDGFLKVYVDMSSSQSYFNFKYCCTPKAVCRVAVCVQPLCGLHCIIGRPAWSQRGNCMWS